MALPTDWITRWDIDVLGSRGMPPSRYDELLRLVADGPLDPGALVTRRVALEAVSERLAAMTDSERRHRTGADFGRQRVRWSRIRLTTQDVRHTA